jgi:uncharacterized protein YkwD
MQGETLRKLSLLLIAALITTFAWTAPPPPAEAAVQTRVTAAVSLSTAYARILADTNAARAAAGLPVLKADPALNTIAQSCSETQARNNAMAHCTGYHTRYPKGWTWAAENVAAGYSYDKVVAAWLNSPGHRANILKVGATHLGIGYAVSATGKTYFTQNFASYPASVRR